jgi:aspartate/methionine/tyrosine aminotransferase
MRRKGPSFSSRIRWSLETNELAELRSRKRERGEPVLDLTESNPTMAGISYPAYGILRSFADDAVLRYMPDPRGSLSAREAIAGYYRGRGAEIRPEDLFLTASTSEAYSFLFKLLCDGGDEVLVPRPSYPLFDFLAALDEVRPLPYLLRFDGAWHLDFPTLESSLTERTRALVAVHPNNPTGSYLSLEEGERLLDLELPLIADEVFLDFPLSGQEPSTFARSTRGLVFVLSGLSKLAGLPQMKLGWIAIAGDRELRKEAATRLEHIADTYLSVGAPVQAAAPRLFELAPSIRREISERIRRNLAALREAAASAPEVTLHEPQGGWYATLRLPAVRKSEEWALSLLDQESVYVHPGAFFGFELEACIIVSLLTSTDPFEEGIRRLFQAKNRKAPSG